jgi:tetratricopeptide (TPR) repeat protein
MTWARGAATSLCSIAVLRLAVPAFAADLTVVVRENDSHGRPLADVVVNAPGAGGGHTDRMGKVRLQFAEKRIGDAVSVSVRHPGHVVVNALELDAIVLPAPQAAPAPILLAQPEDEEAMARRWYVRRIEAGTDAYRVRQLAALRADKAVTPTERKLRAQTIGFEGAVLRDSADKLAAELASENIPGSFERRQQALRLFVEGKVFEAMTMLDRVELFRLREEIGFRVAEAERRMANDAKRLDALAVEHADRRRIGKASDAFARALEIWRTLAARHPAPANPDHDTTLPDLATTLYHLGLFHMGQDHTTKARVALEEALALRHAVATEDTYRRQTWALVTTLNTLGDLYSSEGRVEDARNAFQEGLALSRDMAFLCCGDHYGPLAADALEGLGHLSSQHGQPDEARKSFEAALAIGQDLQRRKNPIGRVYQAAALYFLGRLDVEQGRLDEARKQYDQALAIRLELAADDPDAHAADLTDVLEALAHLDAAQGQAVAARRLLEQARAVRRQLKGRSP